MDRAEPTRLSDALTAATRGEPEAARKLLAEVYDELRRVAGYLIAREKPGQTLQPTALVHEAYLKLVDTANPPSFEDRRHFFNAAANAMRRLLIDRHRRVNRLRHGGGRDREDIDGLEIPASKEFTDDELSRLDGLLNELRAHNQRWSEVLHLRLFIGMSVEQTAEVLGVAESTVKSDWSFSRAWLRTRLKHVEE